MSIEDAEKQIEEKLKFLPYQKKENGPLVVRFENPLSEKDQEKLKAKYNDDHIVIKIIRDRSVMIENRQASAC